MLHWQQSFQGYFSIHLDKIGVDDAKQLRQQTQLVYSLEATIYKAVSDMKRQIGVTYAGDKASMSDVLKQLGYSAFFKEAQKKETAPLINLLYLFSRNMTPDLQAELVADGTPEEDITAIMSYVQTLHDVNVSQEVFKSTHKVATIETIKAYNGINTEIINKISKLAAIFFRVIKSSNNCSAIPPC